MAEVIVEITDEAALEQAALADIGETEFCAAAGQSAEDIRAAERDEVIGNPVGAVAWMAGASGVLPGNLPGAEGH